MSRVRNSRQRGILNLSISNYPCMLKTAAIVAFISTAFGFRVFQIWKLDLELQISLDISLK